jgi:large subunit ribosomal protein L23
MDPYKIIVRPLITEKGTSLNEELNQYPFEVHAGANKAEIAAAVKQIYGVRVVNVRTMNRKGKVRHTRTRKVGHTSGFKRAVVTLHAEDHIDLF